MNKRRIAVAMSGGVDSSVTAHRLVDEGEDVFGVMLRLWSYGPSEDNRCCSPHDLANARIIASQLDIPFYVLDAKTRFKSKVVDTFIDGYAQGLTPNPCVFCNRFIRWEFLLDRVTAMGATHLATGHYARVQKIDDSYQLIRSADTSKDQSYVLHVLRQSQLARALFPIGGMKKLDVRAYALEQGLLVADREDSQDLCFLGQMDYRTFLDQHQIALLNPGPIVDGNGIKLGEHSGLAKYTIGQRKGIGLSAPEPYYVISKDIQKNSLIVGHYRDLGRDRFKVNELNWIAGVPPKETEDLLVQIRYKSVPVPAHIKASSSAVVEVHLSKPLVDITPGQWAVFYKGDICLGGGMILP